MGFSPTYKWGILGYNPLTNHFTNFLGHPSSHLKLRVFCRSLRDILSYLVRCEKIYKTMPQTHIGEVTSQKHPLFLAIQDAVDFIPWFTGSYTSQLCRISCINSMSHKSRFWGVCEHIFPNKHDWNLPPTILSSPSLAPKQAPVFQATL